MTGRLIVISGPAGAGKSTVVRRLLEDCPLPLELSVSATTRPRRPQEQDGADYHFLSREEFALRREADEFLESMEVFGLGHWYGTLRETVTTGLAAGKWIILEIDVEGAQAVFQQYPEVISIFVRTASLDELERRLRDRKTETEEVMARRLAVAERELAAGAAYRHQIINETVDQAALEICEILQRENTADD